MAIYMWREYVYPGLCFTANTANSTVRIYQNGTPTSVTFETSTDGTNWSNYRVDIDTITLSNIGDKVYFRNASETPTGLNTGTNNNYYFSISGGVDASGDISYLLCKNGTDILTGNYCFANLFSSCSGLKTPPPLKFTTLTTGCYNRMFASSGITSLVKLPATAMKTNCYQEMYYYCSNIKLSTTQTGEYQNEYRLPPTGTGSTSGASYWNTSMITGTGGTYTGSIAVNTTYYTSNQVI